MTPVLDRSRNMEHEEDILSFGNIRLKCKESQKDLIEFILLYSKYDLLTLSEILGVSVVSLSHVISGKCYLHAEIAKKLVQWIFVFINR